jgi:hypothetical protein
MFLLHEHEVRKARSAKNKNKTSPEDGGSVSLRNIGIHKHADTELQARRPTMMK